MRGALILSLALASAGCGTSGLRQAHRAELSAQRAQYEALLHKARAETAHRADRADQAARLAQRRQSTLQERLESCERGALSQAPARRRRAPRGALSRLFSRAISKRQAAAVPGGVVFDQGRWFAEQSSGLSPEGQARAARLAERAAAEGWSLEVGVHTGPIPPGGGASSWSLSADRLVVLIQALIDGGVDPARLQGAVYGRYSPEEGGAPGRLAGVELKLR